jgi:hypothetical protein
LHNFRAAMDLSYVPIFERRLTVARTQYRPKDYVAALINAQVCLAYGGNFFTPLMENMWFCKTIPNLRTYIHLNAWMLLLS